MRINSIRLPNAASSAGLRTSEEGVVGGAAAADDGIVRRDPAGPTLPALFALVVHMAFAPFLFCIAVVRQGRRTTLQNFGSRAETRVRVCCAVPYRAVPCGVSRVSIAHTTIG